MLNDPAIGWRSSCARFVIFWLDNIPHACDLYDPSIPYSAYTGTDPGRDNSGNLSKDKRHKNHNNLVAILDGRYLSGRHSGSKGFGYSEANRLHGRLILLGSPLHLLSPPEDTFNFTITLLRRVIKGRYEFREIR
jgi:hypothetical protein